VPPPVSLAALGIGLAYSETALIYYNVLPARTQVMTTRGGPRRRQAAESQRRCGAVTRPTRSGSWRRDGQPDPPRLTRTGVRTASTRRFASRLFAGAMCKVDLSRYHAAAPPRTVLRRAQGCRTRSGTSAPASRIAVCPPGQGYQPDQNHHSYDCSYERSHRPSRRPLGSSPCPKRIRKTTADSNFGANTCGLADGLGCKHDNDSSDIDCF
jgi:hypothetical protein